MKIDAEKWVFEKVNRAPAICSSWALLFFVWALVSAFAASAKEK